MSLRALHIARSGLLAQQAGIEVTSGNIANVNTPGYTRRRLHLSPIVPEPGHVGTGVRSDRIAEYRSRYLDAQIRTFFSRHARSQTDVSILQRIAALLGEPTDETGIRAALNHFFDAVQEVTLQPENLALRELVLQRADELAAAFRQLGADLRALRGELLQQLQDRITQLNPLLQRLAELNTQRAQVPEGSEQAIAVADEQSHLLEELAQALPLTVSSDGGGQLTVSIAGYAVVVGEHALQLQLQTRTDPATGEQTAELLLLDASGRTAAVVVPVEGELGSLLRHFNVTLDPQEQSTEFSLVRELNRFVERFVDQVNARLVQGYGLEDTAAPPPGRRLFEGNTLETIRLSADVAGAPAALPFADAPGEPGNAAIARRLLALAEDTTFADGMTPSGVYAALLSRLGSLTASAQSQQEWLDSSLQQLQAQREALSGVNLDEEASNLIRYQKAYEASARVLTVAASLLDTLIRMGT